MVSIELGSLRNFIARSGNICRFLLTSARRDATIPPKALLRLELQRTAGPS
jgi:hypothetical protein